LSVDWVYRVPNLPGDQPRQPWFMAFRRIAKAPIALVAEGMPEGGGLQKKLAINHVNILAPYGARGNFILQGLQADASSENPVQFGWVSAAGDVAVNKTSDREKVEGQLKGGQLAKGVISGRTGELRSFGGTSVVSMMWQPTGQRVVKLTCQPPQSKEVAGFAPKLGELLLQPYVQTQEGNKRYPAVGAYVKWKGEGNAEWSYLTYEPNPSQEDPITRGTMGSGGGPLTQFMKLVKENSTQIGECGILFLVPDDSTVLSFSFAENTPESMCESPMKVAP
jgi:hypothetical protein